METEDSGAEASPPAPLPVAARRAVLLLFFINGGLFASWVSRIPALQVKLGLSHGTLGLALLGMATGALISMPLAGWCSSRFGSHRVCQLSAVLYSAALPLLALAPNTAMFMLALFTFGASHGALDVAMNAQAVLVEKRYPRPIMASFHALFSLGGLSGAVLGGGMAALGMAPLAHYALAATLLGGLGGWLIFPRLYKGAEAATEEVPRPVSGSVSARGPEKRRLLVLGTVAFCVMIGEGAMADWSAVFLREITHATEGVAAAGYAAFSIAMALGRFGGDRLSLRLGPVNLVRWSGVLAAAGLALAVVDGRPGSALMGFAAVGLGFASVVPQVFSAAGNTPGVSSGPALATVTTLGYLGFLIGPPLIGLLAEMIGLRNALATIIFTSALLILLAPSVRNKASSPLERTGTADRGQWIRRRKHLSGLLPKLP